MSLLGGMHVDQTIFWGNHVCLAFGGFGLKRHMRENMWFMQAKTWYGIFFWCFVLGPGPFFSSCFCYRLGWLGVF